MMSVISYIWYLRYIGNSIPKTGDQDVNDHNLKNNQTAKSRFQVANLINAESAGSHALSDGSVGSLSKVCHHCAGRLLAMITCVRSWTLFRETLSSLFSLGLSSVFVEGDLNIPFFGRVPRISLLKGVKVTNRS